MALDLAPHVRLHPFVPGDRVCLSEDGRRVRRGCTPDRVGTVVKLARDGRHLYLRWAGQKSAQLFFAGYLQRVSYVARFRLPRGNVTGLSYLSPNLSAKLLELLKEAVPSIAWVGVLWNAANPALHARRTGASLIRHWGIRGFLLFRSWHRCRICIVTAER